MINWEDPEGSWCENWWVALVLVVFWCLQRIKLTESLTKSRSKVPATSLSVVKGSGQILQGGEAAVGCGGWEESTGIG